MHAPAPARERRKHGQAGQEAQQPPASPAAVYSFHYVPYISQFDIFGKIAFRYTRHQNT